MVSLTPRGSAVLLFAGHMVDLPDRLATRFSPEMEPFARDAISKAVERALSKIDVSPLALSSGARGGDILFLEACRARGIASWIVLPFPPEKFVVASVTGPRCGNWVERFWSLWADVPADRREVMTVEHPLGPYVACNLRLIELATACGGPTELITLWNGVGGDGPGGTADMVERMRMAGGTVDWIDSRELLKRVT